MERKESLLIAVRGKACLAAALLAPLSLMAQGDPTALRINEILSSNLSTPPLDYDSDYEDMLEIYNPTDTTIVLKDLLLANEVTRDGEKFRPVAPWKFPSGSILPKGFVLVFCDGEGTLLGVGEAHSSFRLDQDGEVVALFDKDQNLIDMVVFPRLAQGTSFGRVPDGTESFCHMPAPSFRQRSILAGGSLVAQNKPCGNIRPEINLRSYESIALASGVNPVPGAELPLLAAAWDENEDGIASVQILYQVDGTAQTPLPMTFKSLLRRDDPLNPDPTVTLEDPNRRLYEGKIPGQPAGAVVTFTLKTEDRGALTGSDPEKVCTTPQTSDCTPPYRYRVGHQYGGGIAINEVVPLNFSSLQDPTDHRFEDYIELCSPQAMSLEGLWLSDNPFLPEGWQFPPGSKISAGERLIVWCDNDSLDTDVVQGYYHTNFSLDNEGEGVFIFDSDANGLGLIDGIKFALVKQDISLSRMPDCSRTSEIREVSRGTPGQPNGGGGNVDFIRGDGDRSGGIDITDPVNLLNHLFMGGGPLGCQDASDANDSGDLDLSDSIHVLNFLFLAGPPPQPPHPLPGPDPTDEDGLTCES